MAWIFVKSRVDEVLPDVCWTNSKRIMAIIARRMFGTLAIKFRNKLDMSREKVVDLRGKLVQVLVVGQRKVKSPGCM